MRFIHISDLHLGRKIYEYSMIEEQKNALEQIFKVACERKVDGILIAGDVYDKSIPTIEAIELFEEFLMKLVDREIKVFIISGNHDSVERVSFGADLFKKSGIYIAKAYDGHVPFVELADEYGEVYIHLLPFVKPAIVKRFHEDSEVIDYNMALKTIVDNMSYDTSKRNVIMVHQFITGALRSDSEEVFLGGLDNVDFEVFDDFDYVAMGHIHRPQNMGREFVRYSGSPIKYSIDEINHKKSMTIIELNNKGDITVDTISFVPLKDIKKLEGTYMELTDREKYIDKKRDDYFHVVLKDEQEIPDALRKLKVIYPYILKLEYSNKRTASKRSCVRLEYTKNKNVLDYVQELYELQNNQKIDEKQLKVTKRLWEEGKEL